MVSGEPSMVKEALKNTLVERRGRVKLFRSQWLNRRERKLPEKQEPRQDTVLKVRYS